MRIRIIFSLRNKGAVLPFHHQRTLFVMLQELLGKNYPFDQEFYSFSGLKGQTKVGREGLHYFSKRVTLVMTSLNRRFLDMVTKAIFDKPHLTLGNLILEPELVEEEEMPTFSGMTKYLCISPLVLLDTDNNNRNKDFIHPNTDDFSDILYESTMERMERSGAYTPEEISSFYQFQIVPDKHYLEKINREEKKFARIYTLIENGEVKEVRGYTLPFALYAEPKVQEFIYKCGFGELTSRGFGMLDLPDTLPTKKSVSGGHSESQE